MAELNGSITVKFESVIMEICESHPTCEGCVFQIEHQGCYFRGKSPKEWHEIRRAWTNSKEGLKRISLAIGQDDEKNVENLNN